MKHQESQQITETLSQLRHLLRRLCGQIHSDESGPFGSGREPATKHDLNKLKEIIMASQAEVTADLKLVLAQQLKTADEIRSLTTSSEVLTTKITELEAIIAAGGNAVTQELIDAVAAVKAQAQVVDDLVPDIATTPA